MRVRCVLFVRDSRSVIMRFEIFLGKEVRFEVMLLRMVKLTLEIRGSVFVLLF